MTLFRGEIYRADDPVLFSSLQQRLIRHLKDEIRAGNLTERALARRAGLSQPHIHNVLKGIRSPTTESADAMLCAISAGVFDLFDHELVADTARPGPTAGVAFLSGEVGPGGRWDDRFDDTRMLEVPCRMLVGAADPAVVTVLADEEMSGISGPTLIDLRVRIDSTFPRRDLYVIVRGGEARLRYMRLGTHSLYFPSLTTFNRPRDWESMPRDTDLHAVVRARVCSVGLHHRDPAAAL